MNPLAAIFNFLNQGGFTLWALVFCSVLLVGVIFERWFKIKSLLVDHEWMLAQMAYLLQEGNHQKALEFCQQVPGCLPRVFEVGLNRYERRQEDIEGAMGTTITEQGHLLDERLGIIGTMAVIAPFIGLFGTVMGIIRSFEDIAKKGASNPSVVSAGVAEALIATAAGLFVAILSVVAFNYYKNRTKIAMQQMHMASNRLVEMILLSREKQPFPEDLRAPMGE
ncbi:MAG: MotA/TolQ/ExbB proton channel family protein [Proteobacteria bacterium]|nr:MotA/TolQ/ExbB proton channel family protein [Pseudomonadota bacterium]